jgi:hypothetical protein
VETATLTSLIENSANKSVRLYAQSKSPEEQIDVGTGKMLIFVSLFFPELQAPVQYIGGFIVDQYEPVSAVFPTLSRRVESDSAEFRVYREGVRPKILKPEESFCSQFVENATLLVFEFVNAANYHFTPVNLPPIAPPEMEPTELPVHEYSRVFGPITIQSFLAYRMRAEAELELASIDAPDRSIAILKAPIDISMRELKKFAAQVVGIEYDDEHDSMLIYTMDFLAKRPALSLLEHLTPAKREKVYFSVVKGMSEEELTQNRPYEVQFSADACHVTVARLVFGSRNATFGDLFDGLKRSVQGVDFGTGPFRFMVLSSSRIEEIATSDREVGNKVDTIRIEHQPPDQQNVREDHVLVQVVAKRMAGETQVLGVPFLVLARKGGPFRDVKERIRRIIGSHPQFDRFVFSLKPTRVSLSVPLADDSLMGPELSLGSEIRINLSGSGRFAAPQ